MPCARSTSTTSRSTASRLEISPREDPRGRPDHGGDVENRVWPQEQTGVVGASERAQIQDCAGDASRARDGRIEAVLEQRLEWQDPRADVRDVLEVVRLERVAYLAQQPRDQPCSVDHEDGDAIRRRREQDAAGGG